MANPNIGALDYNGKFYDPNTFQEIQRPTSGSIMGVQLGSTLEQTAASSGLGGQYIGSFLRARGVNLPSSQNYNFTGSGNIVNEQNLANQNIQRGNQIATQLTPLLQQRFGRGANQNDINAILGGADMNTYVNGLTNETTPYQTAFRQAQSQGMGSDAARQVASNTVNPNLATVNTQNNVSSSDLTNSSTTNTSATLKAQNAALAAQQQNATAPGQRISGPSGLQGLKESDLARTSNGDIFRRDLAAEQAGLQAWITKHGAPKTSTDWLQFHDAVYKGAAIPGATEYPPTQVEPAPEIATDDGLIDLQKAIASFEAQLIAAQNEEIQAQQNLDTFTNETQRGVNAIGQELGRTATLVQGEQYALKQQRQADEDMLVKRLGIAEKKKSNVIEQGRLKMEIEQKIYERKRQIVEDARKLRKDQQETLAASFEMMLKYGIGADKNGNFSPSTLKLVNNFSSSTGIPSGMYLDMLNAAHNDKLNNNIEMIKTNKGRNNYITRIDKTTGKIISETFIGSDPAPAGGGGGSEDPFKDVFLPNGRKYSEYQDDLKVSISKVVADNNKWGEEWNYLSTTYGVPGDILDADLGKDQFYPKGTNNSQGFSSFKTKASNWWAKQAEKKRQGKSILSK